MDFLLDMNKKRKIRSFSKKEIIASSFIMLMLGGYYCGIEAYSIVIKSKGEIMQTSEENVGQSLVSKFTNSSHIYLSNEETGKIKIFDEYIKSIKDFLNISTMQIREPLSFKPIYEGLSSSGVKLYTDLDVIKFEEFDNVKYYKISEGVKEDFLNLLTKSIYFSARTLKDSKNWKEVSIVYENNNSSKVIKKKDYEEFASKISIIRSCGKIQPEKSLRNSEKNFEVIIKTKNNMTYKITIMGKDYIKIELNGKNEEYFEVKTAFYDYLSNLFAL